MNETSKENICKFLQEFPNPKIEVAITLRGGYAKCIKPVSILFGPEIHCRPEDEPLVRRLVEVNKKA